MELLFKEFLYVRVSIYYGKSSGNFVGVRRLGNFLWDCFLIRLEFMFMLLLLLFKVIWIMIRIIDILKCRKECLGRGILFYIKD